MENLHSPGIASTRSDLKSCRWLGESESSGDVVSSGATSRGSTAMRSASSGSLSVPAFIRAEDISLGLRTETAVSPDLEVKQDASSTRSFIEVSFTRYQLIDAIYLTQETSRLSRFDSVSVLVSHY